MICAQRMRNSTPIDTSYRLMENVRPTQMLRFSSLVSIEPCCLRWFTLFTTLAARVVKMDSRERRLAVAAVVAVAVAAALLISQRNRRRRRSVWTRPWIERRNSGRGTLNMVQEELLLEDRGAFQNFLRMTEEQFNTLLNITRKDYERVDTLMRGAISADKRYYVCPVVMGKVRILCCLCC